jgi:phosphate transport system substrate-binding protein
MRKNFGLKSVILLLITVLLMGIFSGCGNTNTATTAAPATTAPGATTAPAATTAPEVKLSGQVIIDGSGTVYPLMAHIAEQYMTTKEANVSVQVGRAGSSAGFKKFIPGELDLVDASRAIKTEEMDELEKNGYDYETEILEIKIALDGLTIVINKDNTWATEMTRDEIVNMYLSKALKADDKVLWSDIRSEWPSEEVKFFGPNENHGTYEFFYEVILKKQDIVATANLQQEYSTLVDLVSRDKNAIAFFGFGYYVNNQDKIQAVKVDFGNGPVEPTLATIGETLPYAGFTRPVFTYVNLRYAKEKPQVLDFAKYVVSEEGATKLAGENGFAPLPADVYAEYMSVLEAIK